MSSLPQFIPPQNAAFGEVREDGKLFVDVNWYLFLYNLSVNTLTTNGELPTSEADIIDMTDLDASGSDVPQSYRNFSNMGALEGQDIELISPEVSGLQRRDNNIQMLLPDADIAPSLRDLETVRALASDFILQDPIPRAQPSSSVTVGASPFTYTAPFDGIVSVTSGTVSAIAIIRSGTTVSTGITTGLIPVRRLDQVRITYTVSPTVVFLPN